MLNRVQVCAEAGARKSCHQQFRNTAARFAVFQPVENEAGVGPLRQKISQFFCKMRAVVLVDCDLVYIGKVYARLFEAVGNRAGGKPGPVLDPAEPFWPVISVESSDGKVFWVTVSGIDFQVRVKIWRSEVYSLEPILV